jgi:alkaline phosphatase D
MNHPTNSIFNPRLKRAVLCLLAFTWCQIAVAEVHHAQGEMAGEVTTDSVLLQSRLTAIPGPELDKDGDVPGAPGVARFEWSTSEDFAAAQQTEWLRADPDRDYIVRAQVTGLRPGTRYFYRVILGADEASAKPGPARQFRTLPGAESDGGLSFIMGSCQNYAFFMNGRKGEGNPVPEEETRLGFPAYEAMLRLRPDFFIGAGDIVYYDHPVKTAARTLPELRKKWHEQFRLPRLVNFYGQTAAFWLKDDHDFRFDDADLGGDREPSAETGIRVFREQMPILPMDDDTSPTYRTHRVHRHLQLWFVEGRDHRSPNKMGDGPDKSIWGAEQRSWLERTLLESDATWKVIVTPTPMIGPDRNSKRDNHANLTGFNHEGEDFFNWAKSSGVSRLLTFCGDRHWQYHSIHPSGVEEFSCGALNDENAIPGVPAGSKGSTDPEGRIQQPFLYEKPSGGFLHVTLGAEGQAPGALRLSLVDDEGTVLYTADKNP